MTMILRMVEHLSAGMTYGSDGVTTHRQAGPPRAPTHRPVAVGTLISTGIGLRSADRRPDVAGHLEQESSIMNRLAGRPVRRHVLQVDPAAATRVVSPQREHDRRRADR